MAEGEKGNPYLIPQVYASSYLSAASACIRPMPYQLDVRLTSYIWPRSRRITTIMRISPIPPVG